MARIVTAKHSAGLLTRILDMPDLPALVQNLDAGVLARMIRHVGLEDSAELVCLTSPEQLARVLDEDVWCKGTPGQDDTFDADRFGLWLEILLESGAGHALDQLSALSEDMVVLGLKGHIRVVDRFAQPKGLSGDEPPDPMEGMAETGGFGQDFGRYGVLAGKDRRWDAILTLLTELHGRDENRLERILSRCCNLEPDPLEESMDPYHGLSRETMLKNDVADQRNERRENKGFVTASSARAFLAEIRSQSVKHMLQKKSADDEIRSYFKSMDPDPDRSPSGPAAGAGKEPVRDPRPMMELIEVLRQAEVLPRSDHPLMLGYCDDESKALPLSRAMGVIQEEDPDLYAKRIRELSFLSNTLMAGCGFKGRSFHPPEAAEAALCVCNLGSEVVLRALGKTEFCQTHTVRAVLERFPLLTLFRVGWAVLFRRVIRPAARAVLKHMDKARNEVSDPKVKRHFLFLAKGLASRIDEGRPWTFLDRLDDLLMVMDGRTLTILKDLMQEYPNLPEGMAQSLDPGGSSMISSLAQVQAVGCFLKSVARGGAGGENHLSLEAHTMFTISFKFTTHPLPGVCDQPLYLRWPSYH